MLTREDEVNLESPKTDEYRRFVVGVRSNNGTYRFCSSSLPRETRPLQAYIIVDPLLFPCCKALIPSFVQSTFIQPFHIIALNH